MHPITDLTGSWEAFADAEYRGRRFPFPFTPGLPLAIFVHAPRTRRLLLPLERLCVVNATRRVTAT